MFLEVELLKHVAVNPGNLNKDGVISPRYIVTRLLEDLLEDKASSEVGYFLAVTSLKSIGKGLTPKSKKSVLFPVVFSCRTFLPLQGEVLQGIVWHTLRSGVFLSCGPAKCAYLSVSKMPNYNYVPGETPFYINDQLVKIEKDVAIRFKVLDVEFRQPGEFLMLASIEGDSLGPVASHDMD